MDTNEEKARPSLHEFQDTPWIRSLFRPLLIAVMAASLTAGPVAILRAVTGWQFAYVLPLAFVAALEGGYSTLQLGRPQWRDRRGLLFRLGELVVLLLLLRMAVYLSPDGLAGRAGAAQLLRDPGRLFDLPMVMAGVVVLMAWGLAVGATGDFLALAIRPDEYAAQEAQARGESRSQQRVFYATSRAEILNGFAWRWGWGGLLLTFCAALSRVSVSTSARGMLRLGIGQAGLPGEILLALLGYFLCGLLLLSQGRLAVLRAEWYNQGITVRPTILRRWHANSAVVLLLVAGVAALLPLGSTNGLAFILEFVIGIVVQIVYVLIFLIMLIFSALLFPLRFLFSDQQSEALALPELALPPRQEVTSGLPDWLGGALSWLVIAAVVGYLLFVYLNAHGVLRARWSAVWRRLRLWGRARWARLSAPAAALARRLQLRRLRRPLAGRLRRTVRPDKLPPASRIRFYYLSSLRRAGERGLQRPPHKTPLEFGRDLTTSWPDAEVDLEALTDAFLVARYAREEVSPTKAEETESVWQRIMKALRRPQHRDRSEGPP